MQKTSPLYNGFSSEK